MAIRRNPLFWLAIVLSAAIFSVTLTYPFNNDNALYAYMAELALHGRLPYIGSWDQNFPAIVLVHVAQIIVSGHSQLAFHGFDIVLQLVGSALLFALGTRLFNARAGFLAAVLAALYYVQSGLWMAGERDTYVTIMLLAVILLAAKRQWPFFSGLLLGLIFLMRPTYGLYAPIFFFANIRDWKRARLIVAGATAPVLFFVLWYWTIGGLGDAWDATILFNFRVYGGTGAAFDLWEPIRFYAVDLVAVVIATIYLRKQNPHALMLWILLFSASVISLLLLYRHSVYHYHPAMTLVILLSAIGWARLADATHWKQWIPSAITALVIAVFFFQTFRGNTSQHVISDLMGGRIHSLAECYDRYEPSSEFGVGVQTAVAGYLKAHTKLGDTVQMFGPYSYPQYAAGLMTASRFQTLHAIVMRSEGDTLQPFQIRWRAEYLQDMRTNHPKYFIVCDAPDAFRQYYGGRLGHEILREDFRELGAWLDSNYIAETKIGAFTLYRSRS